MVHIQPRAIKIPVKALFNEGLGCRTISVKRNYTWRQNACCIWLWKKTIDLYTCNTATVAQEMRIDLGCSVVLYVI